MAIGPEPTVKITVNLSQKETFDKIIHLIENRTKFSIQSQELPTKITAYGS